MKNNYCALRAFIVIITLGISFTSTAECMVFSRAQSDSFKAEVLDTCQVPAKIQTIISDLLADTNSVNILVDRPKIPLIASPAYRRLQSWSQNNPHIAAELARFKELQNNTKAALQSDEFQAQQALFYSSHNIIDLAPDSNTSVLTTQEWDFVIRAPRCEWYDTFNEGNLTPHGDKTSGTVIPMTPSQYQNVSRAFYAKQINDFIRDNNLTRIHPYQQQLAHIPGKPYELSDANYLVVCEKIKNLPLVQLDSNTPIEFIETNEYRFLDLIRYELDKDGLMQVFPKCTWSDLVEQLVQVISYAALWDIKIKNVFLVFMYDPTYKTEMMKVVFLDTEKPGLGGGADENFYHTDTGEVSSNLRTGMEGLAEIFLPLAHLRRKISTYNEQKRQERIKINTERENTAIEDKKVLLESATSAGSSS